jgi:hypothetical protein
VIKLIVKNMRVVFGIVLFGFLFGVSGDLQGQSGATVITSFEEKDLELFGSPNASHDGFYSKLDRTCTSVGKQQLKNQIASPTTDIKALQGRQLLIQWFCEHPEQHEKLCAALKDFELFAYGFADHQQIDTLTQEILKGFYFNFSLVESLNKSPLALDILNLMHGASLLSPVVEHLILHFALEYLQDKITKKSHDHHEHGHHCNHHHDDHHCNHGHDHHHDDHHGHDHHFCLGHLEADHDASTFVKGLFWGIRAAHLGIHLFSIKEMIEHIMARLNVVNCLYKKIAACAYSLRALRTVYELVQAHPELAQQCYGFEKIQEIYETPQDDELHEFINLISDGSFSIHDGLGYFSSVGTTLRAHQLMSTALDQIKPAIHSLAQLDVCSSCATLYQELVPQGQCCFAEFVEQQEPYLEVVDSWNMMLDGTSAVPCSITCGPTGNVSKMILTGPNKSGKSTFMKGIALNILMAQTLGICSAQKLKLKPFDQVITYINIADDIANNQSKFVAEIMRADQCIARLKSLKPEQSAFILIDDSLFSGTNPELGQRAAYDFIAQLAQFDRAIAFVATHLPVLTTLEAAHPSIFKNYKIKLTPDSSGVVSSTFTLEPGISASSDSFILL